MKFLLILSVLTFVSCKQKSTSLLRGSGSQCAVASENFLDVLRKSDLSDNELKSYLSKIKDTESSKTVFSNSYEIRKTILYKSESITTAQAFTYGNPSKSQMLNKEVWLAERVAEQNIIAESARSDVQVFSNELTTLSGYPVVYTMRGNTAAGKKQLQLNLEILLYLRQRLICQISTDQLIPILSKLT